MWWGAASDLWSQAWGEKVIKDLGITIWRNEYYPPSTPEARQDVDWDKQKVVVEGLKQIADANDVDLKFLFTVWSPPADMKWECNFSWAGDANATRNEGKVSTKNGGTLNPNKYADYAQWLKDGLQLYKDLGIDVYGISLQNEPLFKQSFNSCTYTTSWYNELLKNVVPGIKADFPDVKIFGSENMLEMEGKDDNWRYFYHSSIKANQDAANNIDILAVHGYSDGVSASSGSALAKMWSNHHEQFTKAMNKPAWMTETSGYTDFWNKTNDVPGALNLAMDIYSGLVYGNLSAWVWWQGSESAEINNFCLMQGNKTGKKYAVSKHFYRFLRPGAIRIKANSDDKTVLVTAFEHTGKGTSTFIVINSSSDDKQVSFSGTGIAASYDMYRTNSGTENCEKIETVTSGDDNSFILPANSVITLQAGGNPL
ncbi:MAG: hypothetical protein HC819_21475 [Cyclobacteriaceae bacterium]|nr:hypothetical protein [Cyclobacteriaceae bacterium]